MPTVMKFVSGIFFVLFLWSSIKTAGSFRKQRLLRPGALVLTGFFTSLIYLLYILLLGARLDIFHIVAISGGLLAGWVWGSSTKVTFTHQGVTGRGTVAGFVIWALLLAGLQLLNLLLGISPVLLLVIGSMQTAVIFAYNMVLALRCRTAPKGGVAVEG